MKAIAVILLAAPAAAHDIGAPHAHPHLDPALVVLAAGVLVVALAWAIWRRS